MVARLDPLSPTNAVWATSGGSPGWPTWCCIIRVVRRRPTLPQPRGCSTIGAVRLNFRVRNGTGCFPDAMAAVTRWNIVQPNTTGGCCSRTKQWTRLLKTCSSKMCETSPRPISTGRLGITAVHLRPINPIVSGGPYPVDPVGNLILKHASRLDAFSGYHSRT